MEKWKDIDNYPNRQVSNLGRIRSLIKGTYKFRKLTPNERGYVRMQLKFNGKTIAVHRIVAQAFIPNPNNFPEVNHKNGIRHDNRAENLEWVTKSQNQLHARRTGLRIETQQGENHWNASLVASDVKKIRELISQDVHPKIIAEKFRTSIANVNNIKYKTSWKHL